MNLAMETYSPGDILWRRGTVGARKEMIDHPVVVVAVNRRETLGGKPIYTCAPVTNNPQGSSGAVPFLEGSGTKYANLSQLLIAGHDTFQPPAAGMAALLGRLSQGDMSRLRTTIDAVLVPSGALLGKIVYSATPSHDGVRGKPHRPYAVVGEIGRGSLSYLSVPISSAASEVGNGSTIKDLGAAGLLRDGGEDSHTRFAWTAALDARTSSKEAGRLSEEDKQILFRQFKAFKKMLIDGEISPSPQEGPDADVRGVKKIAGLFPGGLRGAGGGGGVVGHINQKPRPCGAGLG
jgi:hypothetical protein